jgi:hypothetical protein
MKIFHTSIRRPVGSAFNRWSSPPVDELVVRPDPPIGPVRRHAQQAGQEFYMG